MARSGLKEADGRDCGKPQCREREEVLDEPRKVKALEIRRVLDRV